MFQQCRKDLLLSLWDRKMREIDVLSKEEQTRLRNLDEALSMLDELYFSIQSKIRRVLPRMRQMQGKENAARFKDVGLRLQLLYQRLIDIETSILGSAIAYYHVYYGPFRESDSRNVEFDKTEGGKRDSARVTSLFHAFAIEYSSILDIGLKLMLMAAHQTLSSKLRNVKSYGGFVLFAERNPRLHDEIEGDPLLSHWLRYEGLMTSIKNRRDLIVHRSIVPLHRSSNRTPSGYIEMEFWSPEVYRRDRDKFDVKKSIILRYNYFCRASLYGLFKVMNANLTELQKHLYSDG